GQEPGAQLLAAMVLGQRSAVSPEVNDAFVATGTIHYLSVSGAHVAMLAFVVWIIGLLAGLTRRKCAVATMVVVTAYALLAEPNAPVWRSALLGNLLCISILLRRPTRSLNWLALAAIILLVIQPTQVFEPGFQLSFLTVIALLHLHPPLRQSVLRGWNHLLGRDDPLLMPAVQDMLNPPGQTRMVLRAFGRLLAEAVIVSFAAWLGSVLLAAHHFHRVPLWGWLDTVVALPLIWLAQILGFVKPVLSLLVPPLGHVFGPALAGLADGLIAVVVLLAKVPWSSVVTPAVPGWLVVAGFGVLGLWIVAERMQISRHVVAIAFLAFLVVAAWRLVPPGRGDSLRLQVLAIGHGAAQIMTLPNGKTMVVDCGSRPPFDLEQWTVGPALARNTIARIDAAIVSHAHLDHYSSIPDLAERRSVGCLMVSPHFLRRASQPGAADLFLREMRELDVPLRSLAGGDRLTGTGETVIDVLWPPADRDFAETNDESIVLRVTYAGWRILICGDIGAQPQEHLLASFDVRADVLVLPHHGTVDAMTDRFIREVNPRVCIRSSGQRDAGQSGGVAGLMSGRQYCSTADVGAVDVRISAQRIRILRGPHEQPTCSISR
ncbi:MAG TPA: ComEC/Rec2 family competence protein, partial [Phycisphaerae bacterium]|nr:ComEC/Rec2 family competence protein [Phycisphaerae bacterium]